MTPKEALNKFNYIFELFLRKKSNEQFVCEIDREYCVDTYVDKNNLFRELEQALDELEQVKKEKEELKATVSVMKLVSFKETERMNELKIKADAWDCVKDYLEIIKLCEERLKI